MRRLSRVPSTRTGLPSATPRLSRVPRRLIASRRTFRSSACGPRVKRASKPTCASSAPAPAVLGLPRNSRGRGPRASSLSRGRAQHRDGLPRRNASGCEGGCDCCFFGCVYNAKQSALVTYLPDAYRAGARFLFDTKADSVGIEGGEVRGVEATFREDGRTIPVHVRARTVVAAGSAIQTPALLLRARVRAPGVGLGVRLDPTTAPFCEFPHPIRMWSGPMQTIVVNRF